MSYTEYDFFSDDFEDHLQQRIELLRKDYGDIPVKLTGNAFVDAGIYAVSIKQDQEVTKVTVNDVLNTILNIDGQNSMGKAFAARNARIKTTSKVLFNNPLNQPAYGSTSKRKTGYYSANSKAEPSPLQERIYRVYLVEFLLSFGDDQNLEDHDTQCLICGSFTEFDFNDLETTLKVLGKEEPVENKDDFGSGPTRTWFPLMGSTSSIQSLPGFAEPNVICGKCLAMAQFLPQVCDLQNGLLTLYQSTDHNFAKEFYRANLETFEERHQNTPKDEKLEIIGKDQWDYYINNLLRIIRDNESDLQHTNLILWRFDNYGTDPDLDYVQLPNRTLQFLYKLIVEYEAEDIIRRFIKIEEENKLPYRNRLFNCIIARQDYILFYPQTKYEIEEFIPQPIYELYQVYIRQWSQRALHTVQTISVTVKQSDNDDELLRVLKSRNLGDLRRLLTPYIMDLLNDKKVETEDLLDLFEYQYHSDQNLNPWKLFQYYLHPNLDISTDTLQAIDEPMILTEVREEYLAIIQKVAKETVGRHMDRSAFDVDKYTDRLGTYRFADFRRDYVRTGFNDTNLTWQRLELLQHHFYRHEILFYFRIFSISDYEGLEMQEYYTSEDELIQQSGLHPILADVIIEYISSRIDDIGEHRIFSELDNDLKYGRYSRRQFFNLLLKKIDDKNIETDFNEYHFFTYEREYSSKYEPKSGFQRKPTFSWRRLRNKLRLFIRQYRHVRNPTLVEQLKEEQQ